MNSWQKQTEEPLFKQLEWDKPERRDQAGRLLIVGGDMHNLGAPASAFDHLKQTGVGNVKVALPSKAKQLLPKELQHEFIFLPSTSSGEFSIEGEIELLEHAAWADSILLPGDVGRNSQTTILFQNLLATYNERIVVTRDALDLLSSEPSNLLERPRTTLVASFAQLQKLVKNHGETSPLIFSMDLVSLVEYLQGLTARIKADIITLHLNQLLVASDGKVSTTKLVDGDELHWRLITASTAICYLTWYPDQPFESLTHTTYLIR